MKPLHGLALLTPTRQRRWLRGVTNRFRHGQSDRLAMEQRHQEELVSLRQQLEHEAAETLADCRKQRRQVLEEWDHSDEQMLASYEAGTLKTRNQKNHDLAVLRRDRKTAVAQQEQNFDQQKNQIQQRYATEKPKPVALQKKSDLQLDKLAADAKQHVENARQIALSRLGGPNGLQKLLADHPPLAADDPTLAEELKSHSDVVQRLQQLTEQIQTEASGLKKGLPVKMIESFGLVIVFAIVLLLWCGGVAAISPDRYALWMLASIPAAVVAAILTHTVMSIPVRQMTREIYPTIENLEQTVSKTLIHGKELSAAKALFQANELRRLRDEAHARQRENHRVAMQEIQDRFKAAEAVTIAKYDQQLAAIESGFQERFADHSSRMVAVADQTATRLANRLQQSEQSQQQQTALQAQQHQEQIDHLRHRVEESVRRAVARAAESGTIAAEQFPEWSQIANNPVEGNDQLRWLPLGKLKLTAEIRSELGINHQGGLAELPLMLTRETESAVIIDAPAEHLGTAAEIVRGVLWRALTGVKPGRVKLTLLDPVGHGQNFASLTALADHDPQLIGHRAWSATPQITARLVELTQHIEDVLQTCLRDRYAAVEHYNRDAMAMAEPYRVVAAIGLPAGLSRDGYDALRALIEGGRRCGVFLILVRDRSQPWPPELPPLPEAHVLKLSIDEAGRLHHQEEGLSALEVTAVAPPPANLAAQFADHIGRAAVAAQRVEIPLDDCVPPSQYDVHSSAEGLSIPVGRQGVGRTLDIDLGSGMRQHMLVAGKTGSGKSTLLHCLITASALRYDPSQLHLYLLDFKKGVEFKVYAETRLPHARVIGIESQREFGLSVLERLDHELQQRGELFRAAGVQELAEYRRRSQQELPRILLVVDEFQELFVRDDRVAQECTMLLDRLVRQGRSFGMHVVLSSQSLSGAYTLPRATLGQMAIRIALQCSESDAALILADDNTAARLLSRPGEAIFNDAGGLIEGNQPFQVAWLDPDTHRQRLDEIHQRHPQAAAKYGEAVIFEGNRPARWTAGLASAITNDESLWGAGVHCAGLLGEAVRIGPPARMVFTDNNGRNALCVADSDSINAVLSAWLPTAVAGIQRKLGKPPRVILFDGERVGEQDFSLGPWLQQAGIECEAVRPRESETRMIELAKELAQHHASPDAADPNPQITLIVVTPLERFRDLRQDDSYGFSLDANSESGSLAFQAILRDGPLAGIHSLVACGSAETLTRWLPRTSQHDLELRLVGRISPNDSSQLIDSPEASSLAPATMLLYDDADGKLEKFRIIDPPSSDEIRRWL